jgi:hypothetical protein
LIRSASARRVAKVEAMSSVMSPAPLRDRLHAGELAGDVDRDVGDARAELDQGHAELALLLAEARLAGRHRGRDDRLHAEIGGLDAVAEVLDRSRRRRHDVDVDGQAIGVETERLLDPVQPIQRVEGRHRVQHHPVARVDRQPAGVEQRLDILLADLAAANLHLDIGDVAGHAAGRKAHEHLFDAGRRDPFGLLDRLADRRLARGHVGDIAALDAAARALAGAQDVERAVGPGSAISALILDDPTSRAPTRLRGGGVAPRAMSDGPR